jgi:hypothetical protein
MISIIEIWLYYYTNLYKNLLYNILLVIQDLCNNPGVPDITLFHHEKMGK